MNAAQIIAEMRVLPQIDPQFEIRRRVDFGGTGGEGDLAICAAGVFFDEVFDQHGDVSAAFAKSG